MKKHYRRKLSYVLAEEFDPEEGLPDGIEESVTPEKFWFRKKIDVPGGRPKISGKEVKAGDIIVYRSGSDLIIYDVMPKAEFTKTYEEV